MRLVILMLLLIKYTFASDSDLLPENENVTKLDLSNKGLTSLKDYDFSKYPLLEEVDLSNNQLDHIATATFEKNKKIEKIDLSGNTKLRFPEYATFLSSNIQELNISNCNIEKTWLSLFDGLRYLKTLDLSNNPIKKKGLDIPGLSTIEKLDKLILPSVDKYTLQNLCTEFTYTILIKDKNQKVKTLDCTKHKKIENDKDLDDVSEKEEQEIAEGGSNAKANEKVQKPEVPPFASSISVDGFSKHKEPDQNKPNEDSPTLKKVVDSQKTIDEKKSIDVVEKAPEHTDEKPHLEPRVDGEKILTDTNKTEGVESSINAPENSQTKPSHTDEEKPNREPREESPDNSDKKTNPEPSVGQKEEQNVKIGANLNAVPEIVISEKPRSYHTVSQNPSVASEETEDKKPPLKPIIDAEGSDANNQITEDENKKVQAPQLLSEHDKSFNNETKIELKEVEKVPSDVSQAKMSEKMQTNSDVNDKESEKVAEVTEASSTGSTILIVLVIAVVVAGLAAFGYKFYKNRTYQESAPVERELKEIVATKPLSEDSVRDITEQEPLMNNHVNKENGNSKPNPIVSNNLSTGPYQPTTTTFKPIDQTDDK